MQTETGPKKSAVKMSADLKINHFEDAAYNSSSSAATPASSTSGFSPMPSTIGPCQYRSAFVYPPPNSYFMEEEFSDYFGQGLSLSSDSTSEPRSRHSGGWSSSTEPDSPTNFGIGGQNPLPYDTSRLDLEGLCHGGQYLAETRLPPTSPFDVIQPSLVRRPPLSHRTRIKYSFCVFCKNNGEDEQYYLSHTLKDDFGRVTCPVLFNYKCPICNATGPVSHTIRYCPDNKEDKYHADFASITLLKQLRSSVGKKGISSTPGVIGGPAASLFAGGQVPPSRRPQMQHVGGGRPSASFQNHVQPSSPSDINMRNLRGPNAAWTRPTNQPCMSQMYGEFASHQERELHTAWSQLHVYASSIMENN